MPRRQPHALRRHQIEMRLMQRRRGAMHGIEHALILLRSGDRQQIGKRAFDLLGLRAHASGDDDLAVLGHRSPDRAKRFLLGAVEKSAGVDDDQIRAVMLAREFVAFRAQPRDDALGIHQSLGASERHETDLRRRRLLHLSCLLDGQELTANCRKYKAFGRTPRAKEDHPRICGVPWARKPCSSW